MEQQNLQLTVCSCGGRGMYVLAPARIVAWGRNGPYAQALAATGQIPERRFTASHSLEGANIAELTMSVCDSCGACRFFAKPMEVKALLDAGEDGVSHVTVRTEPPYR